MAKTYNRMRIDVNTKPADIITEVQADSNSRYLDVFLYDGGVPIDLTGHEVRIYMRKPENSGEIWNNGEITEPTNGRCQFLLTTQALEKMGYLKAQISIWKDNEEILSTKIFDIEITENLQTTGSIEASNEYGALVVLFQNLYEAHDLMTTMVQNIGVPAEVAAQFDLETMWQAWEFLVAYMKGDLTDKINEAIANAAVQGVLDKIGTAADTGGSATAGTLMGKENAILNAITDGAAQTKAFTETVFISQQVARENMETDFVSIEGKGRAFIINNSKRPPQTTVDGNVVIDAVSNMGVDSYVVYFEKSLILKSTDTSHTTYTIQAMIQT